MEFKEWNQYSKEEKETLLKHWWHYYGKLMITLEEQERFSQLVERYTEQIMDVALFSFFLDQSSQSLISAMRQNRVQEFLEVVDVSMEDVRSEEDFCLAQRQFISMLVESYNHSEPDVPMGEDQINEQLKEMGIHPEKVVHIHL